MQAVACIGDMTTGHPPGFAPIPIMVGSPTVFAGGKAVAVIGGTVGPVHNYGPIIHPGILAKGSGTVFVEGKALVRIGDTLACGDIVAAGSPTVFAGG